MKDKVSLIAEIVAEDVAVVVAEIGLLATETVVSVEMRARSSRRRVAAA